MVYETRKRKQLAAEQGNLIKKNKLNNGDDIPTDSGDRDVWTYEDDPDSDDPPAKPPGKRKGSGSTPRRGSATRAKETEGQSPTATRKGQSPTATRKGRSFPKADDPYCDYVALEDSPRFTYLQSKRCQVYKHALPEHCDSCIAKQARVGACRFVGVRKFEVNYSGRRKPSSDDINYCLIGDQEPLPRGSGEGNTAIEQNEVSSAAAPYANIILPLITPNLIARLQREKQHESTHTVAPQEGSPGGPRPMIRLQRIMLKALCDICSTSNFMGAYMCGCCGREVCLACWEDWKPLAGQAPAKVDQCTRRRLHHQESFYFTTRAYPGEVDWMLDQMGSYMRKYQEGAPPPINLEIPTSLPVHPGPGGPAYLATPKADVSNVSLEQFQHLLRRGGIPLVITGLEGRLELPWTAEFFVEYYGEQECQVTDCADGDVTLSTVGEFFGTFSRLKGMKSWKLKDWPPNSDFKTEFPKLFDDFERALPFPEYTTRDAPLNLASRFPEGWIRPDLGPKMYNAYPSPDFLPSGGGDPNPVRGTTNIHFDMTDAVNIMAHATGGPGKRQARLQLAQHGYPDCGAIWDIFPPESSESIRKYLKGQNPNVDDPLNRPLFYLGEDDLVELGKPENGGVQSYRIYQNPGDAVFIPAGCAHQVRNRRSCVKVAVDFFSAENSGVCTELLDDFRNLAYATSHGGTRFVGRREDVLQPWNCMLFNWKALTGLDYVNAFKQSPVKTEAGSYAESVLTDLSDSLFEGYDGVWIRREDEVTVATTEPMEEDEKQETRGGSGYGVAAAGITPSIQGGGEAEDPMEDIEMALDPQTEMGKHQAADNEPVEENKTGYPVEKGKTAMSTGHLPSGVEDYKPTTMEAVEQTKAQKPEDPIETETAQQPQTTVGADAAPGARHRQATTAGAALQTEDKPQAPMAGEKTELTSLDMSEINTRKEGNGENTAMADPLQEPGKEIPTHIL